MDDQLTQKAPRELETLPVRTQFLIFTLFGDYVVGHGGGIWTSSLLTLMELLDVSERAARSALSRMTRKGWIDAEKHGRRSRYRLTARGLSLMERGRERIFEPAVTDWDEHWHLIVYSLPEKQRKQRHSLRTQLAWLGFGQLSPGTWISPHNRSEQLKGVLAELDVEDHVDMFSGVYLGPAEGRELIERSWDLEALEQQYEDFLARFQSDYQTFRQDNNGIGKVDPENSFVQRFWLTHDFQSFPMKDPNLPTILLPEQWAGLTARELFDDYHRRLGAAANQFVDNVLKREE
ncbi:MAG: phenylacetic acid degradation operon negative regulatory protein PaaX [Anaerolineae bacterium]|nr:phenylacetic acid degradation operon negative regulatory protein PaaX [Anaerolineae bacterium]